MYPVCEIRINGQPVGAVFRDRLISCEVHDAEGLESDRVRVDLHDDPPAAIPEPGDTISVRMGYGSALADMGEYVIDEVEIAALPGRMTISARSVDVAGEAKAMTERHWDDATVAEIVEEIASELGLKSAVDPAIGERVIDWIAQMGESPVAFLERLAGRQGALFSIKGGTVIFAARGAGRTPDGRALTAARITPAIVIPDTLFFSVSSRSKYGKVVASYMHRGTARRVEVEVESDEQGDATYRIEAPLATEEEARRAAEAKADDLKRGQLTFRCEIIGDPTARAGAPVVFSGCRVGMDGREWIASEAIHRWSKDGGYRTRLAGSIKTDTGGGGSASPE